MPEYPLKQMKRGHGCHLNTVDAEQAEVTQGSNWESRFHPRPSETGQLRWLFRHWHWRWVIFLIRLFNCRLAMLRNLLQHKEVFPCSPLEEELNRDNVSTRILQSSDLPLANYPSMLSQITMALPKSLTAYYRIVWRFLPYIIAERIIHVLRLTMPTT